MRKKEVFNVVFAGIMISLSCALEFIGKAVPVFQMPNGGSVSLAMLPIAVAAVICGLAYGIASGILFGLLNFLIDGFGFSPYSFILDYVVAFGVLGLIGIFRKQILDNKKRYFVLGFCLIVFLRWIAHSFSGVINAEVWGYDATFLNKMFGKDGLFYLYLFSFVVYNLPYLLISAVLCIVVGLLSYKVVFLNEVIRDKIEE